MKIHIGDPVVFVDAVGKERPAIITAIWAQAGETDASQHVSAYDAATHAGAVPSLNVVYVSDDEAKRDPFGRQIERSTSVVHQTAQPAHGFYWKLPASA